MSPMTDTTVRKEKRRYNVFGAATSIRIIEANQGRFARFTINRGAKGVLKAKMRDRALAKFEAAGFGEGSRVAFYGLYTRNTWTGRDGKLRTDKLFDVLAVSPPKTADQIAALRAAKAARQGASAPAEAVPATTNDAILS